MSIEYKLPDPKEEPQKCLVLTYKTIKGIAYDNRTWDRANFGRCIVPAITLLSLCKDLSTAEKCLIEMAADYDTKEITWTLETIARNAHDWLKKRGYLDANASRAGLRMAIAKRQSEAASDGGLVKVSERAIPFALRNGSDTEGGTKADSQ